MKKEQWFEEKFNEKLLEKYEEVKSVIQDIIYEEEKGQISIEQALEQISGECNFDYWKTSVMEELKEEWEFEEGTVE